MTTLLNVTPKELESFGSVWNELLRIKIDILHKISLEKNVSFTELLSEFLPEALEDEYKNLLDDKYILNKPSKKFLFGKKKNENKPLEVAEKEQDILKKDKSLEVPEEKQINEKDESLEVLEVLEEEPIIEKDKSLEVIEAEAIIEKDKLLELTEEEPKIEKDKPLKVIEKQAIIEKDKPKIRRKFNIIKNT